MTLSRLLHPLLLALACLLLPACGDSSVGAGSVNHVKSAFKDGSIIKELGPGPRLAFAHLQGSGLRQKGAYVFEGTGGVQYRLVRVEWIEVNKELLTKEERRLPGINDASMKLVEDGKLTAIAQVRYEVVPGKKWLDEHAGDLVLQTGGIPIRQGTVYVVRDSKKKWVLARDMKTDAKKDETLFLPANRQIYDALTTAKVKMNHKELAKRLLTDPPPPPEEPTEG